MDDLTELIRFGEDEDSLDERRLPSIGVGGFIVPGREAASDSTRGKGDHGHGGAEEGSEEAGPEAGPRSGRRASAAAEDPPAHAVERGLAQSLKLEELFDHYPGTREVGSSSRFSYLLVPVGLFRSLPYRARLLLEVPCARDGAPVFSDELGYVSGVPTAEARFPAVPAVRAWAAWDDGILIRAHHRYPDDSICACRRGEWIWTLDPLDVYVDWCACWIADVLHLELIGRWPGRQHYPAHVRVQRNRPDEFCGCGRGRRWRECHMAEDLARTPYDRFMELFEGEAGYLKELARARRPVHPLALRRLFSR